MPTQDIIHLLAFTKGSLKTHDCCVMDLFASDISKVNCKLCLEKYLESAVRKETNLQQEINSFETKVATLLPKLVNLKATLANVKRKIALVNREET